MKNSLAACIAVLASAAAPSLYAADPSDDVFDLTRLRVRITADMPYLTLPHQGRQVLLMRHQDPAHTIEPPYNQTSRDCPPFCIQPMQLANGVETLGELEVLAYLQRMATDDSLLLIDSRTADWVQRTGTLPGAENIPYTKLLPSPGAAKDIIEILELEFGAAHKDGLWDFSSAKTLLLFCNGPWCGQSPANIRSLLNLGYPADKLKWYRGGLQAWEQFGLTTVKP